MEDAAALSDSYTRLADEEAQECTTLGSHTYHGGGYDSIDATPDLDAIAGDVQIIEPRKYRFKRTSRISSWPLKLMPHAMAALEGTLARSCVVTAVAKKGKWLKIRVRGGKEGWMQSEIQDGSIILRKCESYRRFEEWGGHNRFYLCGHIMLGSDVRWFMCSNITLTVPVVMFILEICLRFPVNGGTTLAWVGFGLWCFAMVNLWLTALTDPGIIPPNPSNARALPPDGETIGLHGFKFCDTCNIFRPPRSKHCQSCNNCVDRFDHHCPWVGSCVAVRNYRYFLVFVSTTVCFIAYMMAVSVARIVLSVIVLGDGSVPKALEIIASSPLDMLMVAMALLVGLPLSRLWWYHVTTILGKGQTTNEDMRNVYRDHPNEYNKGCIGNTYSMLCAPAPRSRLPDLSELVYVGGKRGRERESRRNSRNSNRDSKKFFPFIAPAGGFGLGGESMGLSGSGGYNSSASPPMPQGGGGSVSSLASDVSLKGGGSMGGISVSSSVAGESSRRNFEDMGDFDDGDYDDRANLLEQPVEQPVAWDTGETKRSHGAVAEGVPSSSTAENVQRRSAGGLLLGEDLEAGLLARGGSRNGNGGRKAESGEKQGDPRGDRGAGQSSDGMLTSPPLARADSGGVSPLAGLSYANSPRSGLDLAAAAANLEFAVISDGGAKNTSEGSEGAGSGGSTGEEDAVRGTGAISSRSEVSIPGMDIPGVREDEKSTLLPNLSTEGLEEGSGDGGRPIMGPMGSMWAAGERGKLGDVAGAGGSLGESHSHSSGEMWYSPTPSSAASGSAGVAVAGSAGAYQAGGRANTAASELASELSVPGSVDVDVEGEDNETFQFITPPPQSGSTKDEEEGMEAGLQQHLP